MEFNVNGIIFTKDDLVTLNLKDLQVGSISHAHLFYLIKNGKSAFLILRAGDYIEQDFVDKYIAKGLKSVYALPIAENKEIKEYRSLYSDFHHEDKEIQRRIIAQQIIQKFGQSHWQESSESILSFILTSFDRYYALPEHVVQSYQDKSLVMYSRAMISSALSVLTCFTHKVVDPHFIQDLYNCVFALDYSLINNNKFNYTLVQACEHERNNPSTGLNYISDAQRPVEEKEIFINHPIQSFELVEKFKDSFHYPEVIKTISFHHEKSNGSGFPQQISYSGLGDFETFQIFCDAMVPFKEHIYHKGDGYKLISKEFEKLKMNENIDLLPINKIVLKWESIMNWSIKHENKDEVA